VTIAFRHETEVAYGVAQTLSPLIRRVVARNPSAFTYHGTGTYVIGRGNVAVVDPGPDLPGHVEALLAALPGERITHQLVTHTHIDHSPAARAMREHTSAPAYGFGPHALGRFERGARVEAGSDLDFVPDVTVRDGDVIEGDGWSIECVHTPGHCSNHLCFALREEKTLFTGDHVMAWATSVISPPDGDMGQYLASLALLVDRDDRVLMPTHGPAITEPQPFVRSLIEHRRERERQVLSCLERGMQRIDQIVPHIYTQTPAFLHGAAAHSVFAHILHLLESGALVCEGDPTLGASYRLA
jgi:glyoxylase-like metal-dependent hydrolase (beta-lactamase superfamily II)